MVELLERVIAAVNGFDRTHVEDELMARCVVFDGLESTFELRTILVRELMEGDDLDTFLEEVDAA